MMSLREYRPGAHRLADFLPWAALVAPGIVLNKDGSFQRTARFRGPDLDSATPAELVAVTARLNAALRRLGSGWAIFVEAARDPAGGYPDDTFPDPVSALVERERAAQFAEHGAHFESRYYLTLTWLPPAEDAARAESWLFEGRAPQRSNARDWLSGFSDRTERLLRLVEGFLPEVAWLDDAATLRYLHACVSTRRHGVRVPETPVYLDALLADEPLVGGLAPRLGAAHLRTLSVIGFPTAPFPGILDELNRLAFAYRWATRAIMLDKTDATRLLSRIRRQWFAKRKSLGAILKEVMTNEAAVLVDNDAANKAQDADMALQELGADHAGAAYVTATVTVWDEDPAQATEKLRQVEKVLQGRDFTVISETMNALEAWLGTLPGQVYANVRQPPVSTLNLAHMIPLSAVWAGPDEDPHWHAAPLFHARTAGTTPFRFALHVGDVGHCLVIGPTGAGKSVLLAFMAMQFRRYPDARIFAFDCGGAIRATTWRAVAPGRTWAKPLWAMPRPAPEAWSLPRILASRCSHWRGSTMRPSAPGRLIGSWLSSPVKELSLILRSRPMSGARWSRWPRPRQPNARSPGWPFCSSARTSSRRSLPGAWAERSAICSMVSTKTLGRRRSSLSRPRVLPVRPQRRQSWPISSTASIAGSTVRPR